MKKVNDIMTKEPVFCTPDTNLREVAQMMYEQNCGEIPVVESNESRKPVGVITDRDITCRTVARGKNPLEMAARDAMSSPAVTVTPESDLDEVIKLMEQRQIRRIPVVDQSGRLCGIVAQADIALKTRKAGEVVKEVSKSAA